MMDYNKVAYKNRDHEESRFLSWTYSRPLSKGALMRESFQSMRSLNALLFQSMSKLEACWNSGFRTIRLTLRSKVVARTTRRISVQPSGPNGIGSIRQPSLNSIAIPCYAVITSISRLSHLRKLPASEYGLWCARARDGFAVRDT